MTDSMYPTFSLSSGVTWFVADLMASRRDVQPAHSAFSSWISDTRSPVVRELVSPFSSGNTDQDNIPFQSLRKKKYLSSRSVNI